MKYQRFTTSGCKDIEIKIFEFVAMIQLLCAIKNLKNERFFKYIIQNKTKTIFSFSGLMEITYYL